MILVDSHCHLDSLDYSKTDLTTFLKEAEKRGVTHYLSVATTLSGYEEWKPKLAPYKNVMLSCGIHPLNLDDESFDLDRFTALASDSVVIALGETGLDYYYQQDTIKEQQERFCQHIFLGKTLQKPLIVHTRSAQEDTLALLKNEKAASGVLHCFTEDKAMAKALLDIGFYISFSGIITFRSAESLRDVVKYVPLSRILVETDSPYLAPVPHRGKPNQPAYVRDVAECLAVLKNVSVEDVARQTTENFCQLFKQSF